MLIYTYTITEEPVDFIRHLEDQHLTEIPGYVTFECELTKANVKVQWQRGKEAILPSKKYVVVADGAVHRLTINEATGDDISDYTAVARGKTSTAKILVEGRFRVESSGGEEGLCFINSQQISLMCYDGLNL